MSPSQSTSVCPACDDTGIDRELKYEWCPRCGREKSRRLLHEAFAAGKKSTEVTNEETR